MTGGVCEGDSVEEEEDEEEELATAEGCEEDEGMPAWTSGCLAAATGDIVVEAEADDEVVANALEEGVDRLLCMCCVLNVNLRMCLVMSADDDSAIRFTMDLGWCCCCCCCWEDEDVDEEAAIEDDKADESPTCSTFAFGGFKSLYFKKKTNVHYNL